MILPDITKYRADIEKAGVRLPLPQVPFLSDGLLKDLPAPPAGMTGWPWTEECAPPVFNIGKKWPRLSIVTPSYNQGRFLEQTIRSVLLQNYPNLEYIVMDGGSNDETMDILRKYAPWISYSQSRKDNGQGQAINMGFSLASGDYYAWINSDDFYLPGVFELVMKVFAKSDVKFVYGFCYSYSLSENRRKLIKIPNYPDFFIKIPTLLQPSTFWSADIHQPVWEELYCALDFELWLRLLKGKKRRMLRIPLSVATVHDDAKTYDPKMKEKWQEDHVKIWSEEGHGRVYEWRRLVFLNRIRLKIYRILKLI
jgi:glycosyltransferase involved in cell wall biosynthesis